MNDGFLSLYREAALTSLGYFWQALWAFALGYLVSSAIQVFVTRDRMQRAMGESGRGSIALGTFFGFISSSCSFAALSTTKSLFKKGAGFMPAMAFLLASTNLVVELGIIIAVFLGWQFVVGEYVGGILLILFAWLLYRISPPNELIRKVRRRLREREGEGETGGENNDDWQDKLTSASGWRQVARQYSMEWGMVWKDVTVGFTIAGIISAFVPSSFFEALFIGAGQESARLGFFIVLENVLIGPIAAFFTFIGSMGNIPLAAILYNNGVSFGGVMAFIFSDLVVLPVLRVNAKYYGWKMALYILGLLFGALVCTSLILHYGVAVLGIAPESTGSRSQEGYFAIDYTFFLNIFFLIVSGLLVWLQASGSRSQGHHHGGSKSILERLLFWLALASYAWLAGGVVVAAG